jgi:Ca-activated chloride channel homolog
MATPLTAVWSALLLLWNAVVAQEPIRVDVKLVTVAFTARDASGALVDNLTRDDFELAEDSAPQKIAFFAKSVDVPLTLGIVVDASDSQEHFARKHEQDLNVFLQDVLGPKDRAFLVGFGNHIRLVSDFSRSATEMLEAWKRYEKDSGRFPELGPKEKRDLGTAFYDSIYYSITEKLAAENGRRAVLMFSDGEDNSSSHDMMTTVETAQSADVLIFAIRYTQKARGSFTTRNHYGIRVMDRIAKETGGIHIDAQTTDPHTYFRQIAEQLRTSYELAYYPTNAGEDNAFRKIVVKAKRPNITVRSKTGYFSK